MGCCSSHGSIKATVPQVRSKPSIFLEENFKLLDYTHVTSNVQDFSNVKDFFANYKLTDVRCVKRLNENEEVHSSVIVISSRVKVERTLEEIW